MVDRIGAVDVAAAILDVNRRSRDLPEQPWIPNPSPSDIDLVVDAVADLTSRPSEVLDIAKLAAQDVGAVMTKVLSAAGWANARYVQKSPCPQPISRIRPDDGTADSMAGNGAVHQRTLACRRSAMGLPR
jgi:hypothetical protein